MHQFKAVGCLLAFVLAGGLQLTAAVRGTQAMYVGGTLSVPEKTEGKLDLTGDKEAVFASKKGTFSIPYENISSIEYGQKAGRRVGVALAISPLALFSKKRKHYFSISYTDAAGDRQGAVLELSKGTVHSIVTAFETRSGKSVEFESEDAKKHFEKEAR